MSSASDWKVPASVQPKRQDYAYDLERALESVVGVRSVIPGDAFSAETLGTERAGNGVLIRRDGVVRTGAGGGGGVGEPGVVAGAGGRGHAVAAHIAARQEFAGYWEYVIDEA